MYHNDCLMSKERGSCFHKRDFASLRLSLSTQELKDIDNLVAVGKFDNRSSAIKWLIAEGIATNRAYLDKVADARNQIERLKREVVRA